VAGQLYHTPLRPPPLYRVARALRRASVIVLVLLIVYVGTVAYSAVSLVRSSSSLSSISTSFVGNNSLLVSGTLTLNNPGFYPVNGFSISLRLATNASVPLGDDLIGPFSLPGQGTSSYPVSLEVPVTASGPAVSLLTQNQQLKVRVWANATYAYLFPVAITIQDNRSWGAPFANLQVAVSGATLINGTPTVSVMVSFQNEATFADAGSFNFAVLSSSDATCGSGSLAVDVPPGEGFTETTPVSLASGCNPSGGKVTSEYVTPSYTIDLPPEAIP
jgi:hypothetical protein